MRESEIERRLQELEEKIGESESNDLEKLEEKMEERLEEIDTPEDLEQKIQTLKMQLGKVRSRVKDLEEKLDEE